MEVLGSKYKEKLSNQVSAAYDEDLLGLHRSPRINIIMKSRTIQRDKHGRSWCRGDTELFQNFGWGFYWKTAFYMEGKKCYRITLT